MRQLKDINFYQEQPNDPTEIHCELVNNVIEKFKREGKLDVKLAEGLKIDEPRLHYSTYYQKSTSLTTLVDR